MAKELSVRQKRLQSRRGKKRKSAKVFIPESARGNLKLDPKWTGGDKPSPQDLEDAKKEAGLTKVLKNKPKGGYKDTSPKPKPKSKTPQTDYEKAGAALRPLFKKGKKSGSKGGTQRDAKGREIETYYEDGKYKWRPKSQDKLKINGDKDSKKPKLDTKPKKTEAEERAEWEEKTRNSPARRSVAWTKEELWEKQKAHRKWKKDRKEGKLKREKFNPRAPRGTQRKLVKKTAAELAADQAKAKVRKARKDPTGIKDSKNQTDKDKKRKTGLNI